MTYPKIFWILALLLLCCSNCTMALHAKLEDMGSPAHEINGDNGVIRGSYIGDIEKDGTKQALIYLYDARVSCHDNSPLQLLLPLSTDNNSTIELREVDDVELSAARGGKPVNVALDNAMSDNKVAIGRLPKLISSLGPWEGYPARVLIFANRGIDSNGIVVGYRYGERTEDFRFGFVRADIKWICRSRKDRIAPMLAYPLTFAADMLASPLLVLMGEVYVVAH